MTPEVPQALRDAFATRATISAPELCRLLPMDDKTLRRHVQAGNIRYVLKGPGSSRPRRVFMMSDVLEFLSNQGRRECQSTSPKTRNSTSTTSSGEVYDFMARRNRQKSEKPSV